MAKTTPLASRLKSAMEAKEHNQMSLARDAGVDQGQISRMLSGAAAEMKSGTAAAIAKALDVSLDWLLTGAAPAQASAAAGAATTIEGDAANVVRLIAHADILASPLNPRKHFDAAEMRELADNIASNGLLQNLVARPHAKKQGKVELAAGERRWRAIGLLIKDGRWPAERPIAVQVRALDDYELLELGAGENIQRANMSPIEEGEAFAALVDAAKQRGEEGATEKLAARFGKTMRWVQQRVALARKLAPKVKTALMKGEINLEQAKAFTLGDQKTQVELLKEVSAPYNQYDPMSAEDIRDQLREVLVPVERALFPVEGYKGEIVDDDGERFFADKADFLKLQNAEIARREVELKATWAFVERIASYWYGSDYPKSKDKTKAGAFIVIKPNHSVEIHEGRLKPKPAAAARRDTAPATKGPTKKVEPWTQGLLAECKRRKTAAMQTAIMRAEPIVTQRLVCLGLMVGGEFQAVKFSGSDYGQMNGVLADAIRRQLAALAPRVGVKLQKELGAHTRSPFVYQSSPWGGSRAAEIKIWKALQTLDAGEVLALMTALVAARVGTFNSYKPEPKDDRLAAAIADTLGVTHGTMPSGEGAFVPDDEFLKGYRKPGLVAAAIAAGVYQKVDAAKLETMTGGKIRGEIIASPLRLPDWIPEELKFTATKPSKEDLQDDEDAERELAEEEEEVEEAA